MYSKYTVGSIVSHVLEIRKADARYLPKIKNQIIDTLISLFSSCRIILVRGGGGGSSQRTVSWLLIIDVILPQCWCGEMYIIVKKQKKD